MPADVIRDDNPLRHDPVKLATAVMQLYENRGGKGAPGRVKARELRAVAENGHGELPLDTQRLNGDIDAVEAGAVQEHISKKQ